MRTLSRVVGLALALLLITQAGWATPVCGPMEGTAPAQSHHHPMPAGQHEQMPAPAHHPGCQLVFCAMMTGCSPVALQVGLPGMTLDHVTQAVIIALQASSSPLGPAAPEPPPPRA